MNTVFVTGAAGFIGSNLVDRLLSTGSSVVGWDNFSTGQSEFLESALTNPRFRLIRGDMLDRSALALAIQGSLHVFHLAANADVRFGTQDPSRDLEQNTVCTHNLLEAMRKNGIRDLTFSSTGSVYGDAVKIPTPEDHPYPIQTSLYGASKSAAEGFIQAYCEGFDFNATIFRFVSILGERYTHGHVLDFYKQLLENPGKLRILGDGNQRKSYLYVQDCVEAMVQVAATKSYGLRTYNLGTAEHCQVLDSVRWICEHLRVQPELEFSGGDRGWVGDSPFIYLDTTRIRETGWAPKLGIQEALLKTLRWLESNQWVLEKR